MNIKGRAPHAQKTSKKLRISVQCGCESGRQLAEALLQQQRQGRPVQLIKLLGKDSEEPSILPHNVQFSTLSEASSDHVSDVIVILSGQLSEQFEHASKALQSGKHVVVGDARLMQAYGDLLQDMATAYHGRIGTTALLADQGALAHTLSQHQFTPVREVLHYIDDARNTHLASQETVDHVVQSPEFPMLMESFSSSVNGILYGDWSRIKANEPHLPSPHCQQIADRLGGAFRYVSRINAQHAGAQLCFLPYGHPLWQGENTTLVTFSDGSEQTLNHQGFEGSAPTVRALLQDIFACAQPEEFSAAAAEISHAHTSQSNRSLVLTQTATWREHKDNVDAHILSEQLVGTTLVVTLRHEGSLELPAEIGTVCALPQGVHLQTQQQVPQLHLAS